MEPFKIRLKVGDHEFEAEGDQESVERQIAVWRALIAEVPAPPPPRQHGDEANQADDQAEGAEGEDGGEIKRAPGSKLPLSKILQHDGRVVSLTMPPPGEHPARSAALLILLGQAEFNRVDLVGGQAISDGLTTSGMSVKRIDRLIDPMLGSLVVRSGKGRAVKYRLTHPGKARAEELAKEMIAMVP